MADLTPRQTDGVPGTMQTRYRDMLDGTHAEVIAALIAGGAVDITDRADRDLGVVRVSVIGTGGNVIGSVRVVGELPAGIQTIGAARILATHDGAEFVPPRLDASTFALESISDAHHEIHEGAHYRCHYNQMVSDVNDRTIIAFRTPDTTKYLHMLPRGSCSARSSWYIWRAPNIVDNEGTPLAIYNNNENSPNTSGVWDTSQNPDVQGQATYFDEDNDHHVTGGTDIDQLFLGTGSGPRAAGGEARGDDEIVLLPNTLYAFELKSLTNDDNDHNIVLRWYEHVDLAT